MKKPTRPRVWPTHKDQLRRDIIARADDGAARCVKARQAIERMQTELALVHNEYIRGLWLETAREMEKARQGEPDDLAIALAIIADLRAGRPAEHRADALLAQYALET